MASILGRLASELLRRKEHAEEARYAVEIGQIEEVYRARLAEDRVKAQERREARIGEFKQDLLKQMAQGANTPPDEIQQESTMSQYGAPRWLLEQNKLDMDYQKLLVQMNTLTGPGVSAVNAMNAVTGTGTLVSATVPVGQTIGTSYGHMSGRSGTSAAGPSHSMGAGKGSAIGASYPPVRSLGNDSRDTFYMALRGIEEAAMKNPKGNHDYDSLATKFMDMRKFDGRRVSLLGLCSFCLSNMIDPQPLVTLLTGHGLTVE